MEKEKGIRRQVNDSEATRRSWPQKKLIERGPETKTWRWLVAATRPMMAQSRVCSNDRKPRDG